MLSLSLIIVETFTFIPIFTFTFTCWRLRLFLEDFCDRNWCIHFGELSETKSLSIHSPFQFVDGLLLADWENTCWPKNIKKIKFKLEIKKYILPFQFVDGFCFLTDPLSSSLSLSPMNCLKYTIFLQNYDKPYIYIHQGCAKIELSNNYVHISIWPQKVFVCNIFKIFAR